MIAQILVIWLSGIWCGFSMVKKSVYGTPASEFVVTWILPLTINGVLYLVGFYDCFVE